jgi:hypothetical protein
MACYPKEGEAVQRLLRLPVAVCDQAIATTKRHETGDRPRPRHLVKLAQARFYGLPVSSARNHHHQYVRESP